jgi:Immunoglobulin-like domain of bacterial spore germination
VNIGKASSNKGTQEVKIGVGAGEGGAPISDPKPTMSVFLKGVGSGGGAPYAVVASKSAEIVVSAPDDYASITSPVRVAGAAGALEGNVEVEVREDGQVTGKALGVGNVAGAGEGKLGSFDNGIFFKAPARTAGAVVLLESSAEPGHGISRATVVRVTFGSSG